MKQSPLFTVIIATYNRKHLLPGAIASVLNQTFGDFELLVIDNGSTDGTEDVVQGIKDSRLKYIRNPNPTNSCEGPRNLGIQLAKGSFISFLDDDDRWYPDKLEKTKRIFGEHPDISLVGHDQNMVVRGKKDGVLKCGADGGSLFETLLYERNCIYASATTIKAETLREFNGFSLRKEFYAAADIDLWLRLAKANVKMYFLNEPFGECLITGDNGSIDNPTFGARLTFLITEHILNYEKKPIFLISKKGMWRLFQLNYFSARSLLRGSKFGKALRHFLNAGLFLLIRPTLSFNLCSKLSERISKRGYVYEEKGRT